MASATTEPIPGEKPALSVSLDFAVSELEADSHGREPGDIAIDAREIPPPELPFPATMMAALAVYCSPMEPA